MWTLGGKSKRFNGVSGIDSRRNKRRTPPGSASMDRISESMLGIPRIPWD